MIDKSWIFVLGAQDPEMREIEAVLRAERRPWMHAAYQGQRVTPMTAYAADGVIDLGRNGRVVPQVLPPKAPAVFVECSVLGHPPAARVDHHHPGDPGFDAGPLDYMQGSSIGQVLSLLQREPTPTQRLLAAGDHCLNAAYQGQCPGVDPDELLFLRASWQAKINARSLSDVIDGILRSAREVRRRYDGALEESRFLDPLSVPRDLPEGAAYAGLPVRYRALMGDGIVKEMLKGAVPERVTQFMDEHAALGRRVYGNPNRGYAGAYLDLSMP